MEENEWPSEGRVGLAMAGEYAHQFIFVFIDRPGFWGFYTSRGGDDAIPDTELIEIRLQEAKIAWLEEPEESLVERAIFAMRPMGVEQPSTYKQFLRRLRGDHE